MKTRLFETRVWLPLPRDAVFAFFSDARNLQAITPPWLDFEILNQDDIRCQPGTLIDYRLRLHGIPFAWRTLISSWEPPLRFVDEQVRGPFRVWRHEHRFEEADGLTCCIDRVEYAALGGRLVEALFVERDVRRIFAFRRDALARALGVQVLEQPQLNAA